MLKDIICVITECVSALKAILRFFMWVIIWSIVFLLIYYPGGAFGISLQLIMIGTIIVCTTTMEYREDPEEHE